MDRPIRRAVALFGGVAERHAHDFAAAFGVEHAQALRCHHVRPQPLAKAELDQRAGGVGRELDASAGFLEPLGLLQYDHAKAVAGERKRRGQPGDAGACDDDGAGRGQGTRSPVRSKFRAGQCAFRRPRRVRLERRIVAVERRAIGADIFGVVAHVAEHMGMVERRLGADAHEFPGADVDHGNAGVVVEVGNDRVRHGLNGSVSGGTIAVRWSNS